MRHPSLYLALVAITVLGLAGSARAQDPSEPEEGDVVFDGPDAGPLDAADAPADEPFDPTKLDELLGELKERKPVDPKGAIDAAPRARQDELSNPAYRFCHDEDYGKKGTDGVDFCLIFDESSDDVCPAARAHCKEWRAHGHPCDDPNSAACKAFLEGRLGGGKSRVARRQQSSPWSLDLPPIVSYLLIGIAVSLALLWFLRSLKKAGWESDEGATEEAASPITDAERNLQALPEARSSALLRQAERALELGNDGDAAILIHLAVLRHLDDEGIARYHPSKTNGDYLRTLRSHESGRDSKPLTTLFRGIARETERLRFGDGTTDHALLEQLLGSARRTLVRSAAAPGDAAAAATIALLAIALTQTACGSASNDPAYHTRGPAGMAALPAVLRNAGLEAEVSRTQLGSVGNDVGVIVIRTSAASGFRWPKELDVDALLVRNVSIVVIDDLWHPSFFLPVTATAAAPRRAVTVAVDEPSPDVFCTWKLADHASASSEAEQVIKLPEGRRLFPTTATSTTSRITKKPIVMAPLLSYANAPTLPDGRRAALAWAVDRVEHGTSLAGCLYVFADRDLFTNASLTRPQNARFVVGFFSTLVKDGRKIVLLDRFDQWAVTNEDGSGGDEEAPSPAKSLTASNLLPFLAQSALLLVALFIAVGAAFGPLRDPAVREHKAFVEHVEAIGRQYARTGIMGLTHSARSLARLVVMRNRDMVRGGSGGGWSGVSQHLANKLDLDEKDVRAALRLGFDEKNELGTPGPDDPSPASERMLRTLSRLLGSGRNPSRRGRERGRR
ncbi:DUF4129 domain-containing protein [Myxococcota bacterium]|nr:DUF4129 domain-containing protein [Myxococcota bacterium]